MSTKEQIIDSTIESLKKNKFITQVIAPEKLTKENIKNYVTQVGIASKINLDEAANEPAPANVEPEEPTKKSTKSTKKEEPAVEPEPVVEPEAEELPVVDEPEVEE